MELNTGNMRSQHQTPERIVVPACREPTIEQKHMRCGLHVHVCNHTGVSVIRICRIRNYLYGICAFQKQKTVQVGIFINFIQVFYFIFEFPIAYVEYRVDANTYPSSACYL